MTDEFADLKSEYENLWATVVIQPERAATVDAIAKRLIDHKALYTVVERSTGVPWFVIAALHNRESDADFDTYLGNGEPLDRVTRIVPVGRGPFDSWEEGAIDALKYDGLDKVKDWTPARACYEIEKFNGFGYRDHHSSVKSPYLWSFTNHYTEGKYTSDGQFDDNAVDKQCGAIPVLKRIIEMEKVGGVWQPKKEPAKPSGGLGSVVSAIVTAILALFRGRAAKPAEPPAPAKPTDDAPQLTVARKYIGLSEKTATGNSTICGWMAELGGAIAKLYKTGNARTIPWCAGFIGWCLHATGLKYLDSLLALDYAEYGVKLDGPAVGAIGPMGRDGGGHVAFVVGRDQNGNIMCIGGNQGDAVSIKPFKRDRFVSFRWPAELPLPPKVGFDHLPVLTSDGKVSSNEV